MNQPRKKNVHKTLKDKIKLVVKDDKDVRRIMDYVYWEVTKLVAPNRTDKGLKTRVLHLLKDLKK